jgi:hypothetical protein
LGWPGGIGLGLGSVLLRKVSGSILSGANLGGLFSFFKKLGLARHSEAKLFSFDAIEVLMVEI